MSLTGHRMPPRTTQQSQRPRVSDRTMVGALPPRCLQALPHGTKNAATDGPGYRATPRSTTEPHTGLDARHLPSPSPCGRGEVFSLDIPFYRTRAEYENRTQEKPVQNIICGLCPSPWRDLRDAARAAEPYICSQTHMIRK